MSCVFFAQSYWNLSHALIHLWCEFILGLSQIEFESFLQGLVQQNKQYLPKHIIGSKIKLETIDGH
jgi:hypothetical protein